MDTKHRLLKQLFSLTSDDKKFPTDLELDSKISLASIHMHELEKLTMYILKRKIVLFFKYKWILALKKLIIFSLFIMVLFFGYNYYVKPKYQQIVLREKISLIETEMHENPIPIENIQFMVSISLLESNLDYTVARGQYWGKYQIGTDARKEVGLGDMPKDIFLSNPAIQNWAMNQLILKNYEYLKSIIVDYNIPEVGGIRVGMHLVTISGLIASAHLVGYLKVKEFIKSNGKLIAKDGNNKPLTDYLQLNNLKLNFNK